MILRRFFIVTVSLFSFVFIQWTSLVFGEINSPKPARSFGHLYKEAVYRQAWCQENCGKEEVINSDKTRVDCLTATNAVEFDFASKWAESVGQALHYQLMTCKRAKVVLIIENPQKDMKFYDRVKKLAEIYDFDVEYVTPEIVLKEKNVAIKKSQKN